MSMKPNSPPRRTPLGQVRGLGSAQKGVSHWWMQRVTAMGMIPLIAYLIISFLINFNTDYMAAMAWLGAPLNATAMLLLFGVGFYHASLGLQVVIEDYVSNERRRLLMLVAVKMIMTGLTVLSLFSVLSVAFAPFV